MNPFAESGIAVARRRMQEARAELLRAADAPDHLVWEHLAKALGHVTRAVGHIDDAMRLEQMCTADTLPMPPESGEVAR